VSDTPLPYEEVKTPENHLVNRNSLIKLGDTKLKEYTKIQLLGKGTYGEVFKCIHKPTGLVVAMKTYFFEVS
jgi:serine/threonine protein kinase